MVQRVQMKTVNFDGGLIYYPDAVVDMEDNKANYLLGLEDVIPSAAGLSTAPPVPVRIDNSPGGSGADKLLGSESNGLAFDAKDNSMTIRDQGTPANNYRGNLPIKLGNIRASNAMRYNASGLLELVTDGSLRLDYDPRLAGGPGYLVEEARTNLALRSQEFDNAQWATSNASISANSASAPDGSMTADTITATATISAPSGVSQTFTGTAAQYTLSVFVKILNGSNFVRLALTENGIAQSAWYNLGTGTVATVGAGVDATSIQSVGNGWYRCSITCTCAAVTETMFIRLATADGNTTSAIAGHAIYVWGAQLELGPFASSHMPTAAAAVTRATDNPIQLGSTFPLNSVEGTLAAKTVFMGAGAQPSYMMAISDGGIAEQSLIARVSSSRVMTTSIIDSSTQVSLNSVATVADLVATGSALGYKLNDTAIAQAGEAARVDTVCTMPTVNQISYGNRTDGNRALNGWLKNGKYIPRRTSNAELEAIAA